MRTDLLAIAESLRWARPDIMAALADHALRVADRQRDRDGWLAAAGAVVASRTAIGDGRPFAVDLLGRLPDWGPDTLRVPAAYRLRIEVAGLAAAAGKYEAARLLVEPVPGVDLPAAARSAVHLVQARSTGAHEPDARTRAESAIRAAAAVWASPGAAASDIERTLGAATVALTAAAMARGHGRPDDVVDQVGAIWTCLDPLARTLAVDGAGEHIKAALIAELVTAQIDAGRVAAAAEIARRHGALLDTTLPGRQRARLRLAFASALAVSRGAADTVTELEIAAKEAGSAGVHDLESVCRSALGALHEKAGRLDAAVEELRAGLDAKRVDQNRETEFVTVLDRAVEAMVAAGAPAAGPAVEIDHGLAHRVSNGASVGFSWLAGSVWSAAAEPASPAAAPESIPESVPEVRPKPTPESLSAALPESPPEPSDGDVVRSGDPWAGGWGALSAPTLGSLELPSSAAAEPAPPSLGSLDGDEATEWMRTALAELDRTWGRNILDSADAVAGAEERAPVDPVREEPALSAPEPAAPPTMSPEPPAPPATGCTVVVDIARDGRRFAGRRAGAVIRDVAEIIDTHLPVGGRLRFEEGDALAVVLPGWAGQAATQWMHRTLPGLLSDFVAPEDLPGTQLRASVHDVDGPVGAQLLYRIDVRPRQAPADPASRAERGRHGAVDGRAPFRVQPADPVVTSQHDLDPGPQGVVPALVPATARALGEDELACSDADGAPERSAGDNAASSPWSPSRTRERRPAASSFRSSPFGRAGERPDSAWLDRLVPANPGRRPAEDLGEDPLGDSTAALPGSARRGTHTTNGTSPGRRDAGAGRRRAADVPAVLGDAPEVMVEGARQRRGAKHRDVDHRQAPDREHDETGSVDRAGAARHGDERRGDERRGDEPDREQERGVPRDGAVRVRGTSAPPGAPRRPATGETRNGAHPDGSDTSGRRPRSASDGGSGEPAETAAGVHPSTGDDAAAPSPPGANGDRPDYESGTDGLGLADLLAGALAAYRGI